jgi:hypothetical protein
MRASRILTTAVPALLCAVAFASAASVSRDYDKTADFTRYKTYAWAKPVATGNELSDKRITSAVEATLAAEGWTKAEQGADIFVAAHAVVDEKQNIDTIYSGWGPGWGYHGGGIATTQVTSYLVGTLIVDMFDGASKSLVWRGTATDTITQNPDKNEKTLAKALKKLFSKFPPEPKT